MSELFASIKAFIEKGNIIIFLLAVAVAIFTYQILARAILWSVFAFCLSYAAFYGIQNLYNDHKANIKQIEDNRKKQEAENIRKQQEDSQKQKEQEQIEARLRTIYASLPDDVKEGLELFYNLPQTEGGFVNARIVTVENEETYSKIYNAYTQIRFNLGLENLMESQHSIQSLIITIMPEFFSIIEEKAKKGRG
jgi:septal ring factor EnvC (AmiA/AmiB activator)